MKLHGKVAIVTGARAGIGRATALALAEAGADVVICDNQKLPDLEAVAEQIQELGVKGLAVKADISKEDEVDEIAQKTIGEFGKVDILVNNAAFTDIAL